MKKAAKLTLIGAGVVLAAIVAGALRIFIAGGAFTTVERRFAGTCSAIATPAGSADIAIDRERGLAYLSILDRAMLARGEATNGTIMLLDLNIAAPAPRAALAYDPPLFRPGGISLLKRAGAPSRLFAISLHDDGAHAVEIFEESPAGGFTPKDTVRDRAFTHPRALVATGPREFYIVNEGENDRRAFELLAPPADSSLIYFDGQQAHVLASDLRGAGGIAMSLDGTHIYVSEMLAESLRVYARAKDGALSLERTVALDAAPEGVTVDPDGALSIAAHPKLLAYFAALDGNGKSPTEALRVDPREGARVTSVYSDPGKAFSSGSVAARWRDEILLGSALDPQVLICKQNP